MKTIIRAALHISPLVPLFFERPTMSIPLLLFLLICYIKVFKLQQLLSDQKAKGGNLSEERSIEKALRRWHGLTYLKAMKNS